MSNFIFFSPGIHFMQRLTFRKKMLSLAMLFIIPVAWLMAVYVSDSIDVIQFSEKEQIGAAYLKSIYPIIKNTAQTRGLTNAYLNGSTGVKSKIDSAISVVNSAFDIAVEKETLIHGELNLQISIESLRKQWNSLHTNALTQSAQASFTAYNHFIKQLHKYVLHVADQSNLILDPDLDSYYLMGVIVVQLPEIADRIGQARGLGAGVAAKQTFTPEEFTQLAGLIEDVKLFGENVSNAFSKVYFESAELKESLSQYENNFTQQWQSFIQLSENKMLRSDSIQIESSAYFKAGTEALKHGYVLLNASIPVLDDLIEQRIVSEKIVLYETIGVMVVVLLLAGYLFQSFSISVKNNMDEINTTLISLSNGNFQVSANVTAKDEVGAAATHLNEMIEKIRVLISQVVSSATQVASAAEQASTTAAQAQDGINRQNSEIEQVATAINEMSATVHEVAQNTSSAAELTQTADAEANSGRQVVSETIDSINRLAGEMQSSSQIIKDLETQSESIGTVLDVIRGIAEQTNLLALNAAIEAARAGEQGRGFAVVADEVRTLASRTQDSTTEINDMIGKLQTGARNAVQAMEQGTAQTEQSVEQALQAGTALDQISTAVTTIRDMNTQIASAAEEQSSVSEEINRNIVNIRDIAEATIEGANQTAQSSAAMSQVASELMALMNEFKV